MKKIIILGAIAIMTLKLLADECGEKACINTTFQNCSENCDVLAPGCSITETTLGGEPYPTNCEDLAAADPNEICKMQELAPWQVAQNHNPSQIVYDTYTYACDGGCSCDFGDQRSEQHSGPTYDWVPGCYNDDCVGG